MERKTAWQRFAYGFTTAIMALFGCTGLASASSINGTTGPGSTNTVSDSYSRTCIITNNNNVSFNNSNNQTAVSGNALSSDNTAAAWSGWTALNPMSAQANGDSFSSWWSSVNDWLSAHSSAPWGGSSLNTSWMPSSNDWSSWDPVLWQSNNQSFNNWSSQLSSWLNSNSAAWMMSWPAGANESGIMGGTSTGDASNVNTTNFSIHISNSGGIAAASPLTDACGRAVGGSGGGSIGGTTGPGSVNTANSSWNGMASVANNTGVHYGNGNGQAAYSGASRSSGNNYGGGGATGSASNGNNTTGSVGVSSQPAGGSGGSDPSSWTSGASISGTTGPDSTNTATSSYTEYTSVTNNNNVSVSNSSWQYSSTGSSTSSGNTWGGGDGTGAASNGNATGGNIVLNN